MTISVVISVFCFFLFKQKTAYDMRISDWSSDVCSSDLSRGRTPKLKKQHVLLFARRAGNAPGAIQLVALDAQINWSDQNAAMLRRILTEAVAADQPPRLTGKDGRASWRDRVCQYM